MRYEAGDSAIVVGMKRVSNDVLEIISATFLPKNYSRPKAIIHDFGSKFNRLQNGHHWNAPFMLITTVQIPASYLLPSPRYLAQYLADIIPYLLFKRKDMKI